VNQDKDNSSTYRSEFNDMHCILVSKFFGSFFSAERSAIQNRNMSGTAEQFPCLWF